MPADNASELTLESDGDGRYRLVGTMDFTTVPGMADRLKKLLADNREIQVDLTGVRHSNSAGLGLLLEWLRQARLAGGRLGFENIPDNLLAIAKTCDLDALIGPGPRRD